MTKNVGFMDKTFRLVVGLAAIAVGYYYGSWWGAIGLIPIFTAIVEWCPIYAPLGFSTNNPSSDTASD